jgi:MinD superfamily P-loop ATPase
MNKQLVEFSLSRKDPNIRKITPEEALELCDETERLGLIHEGPFNYSGLPGVMCSCCDCSCGVIISCKATGRIHELYAPTRFQPVVDQGKCNGCQTCVEKCPFGAMEMVKTAGSKKMKSRLIEKECMGCGVCVVACPQKALNYELIRPPEHIPPASNIYIKTVVQLE